MTTYFKLQYKMLTRKLVALGLPLGLSYLIVILAFALISMGLFSKTEFAGLIYIVLAVSFMSGLSEESRNEFLQSIFSRKDYLVVRVCENMMASLPFLLFLCYKALFIHMLILIVLTFTLVFFSFQVRTNYTVPTPFGLNPFEFTVGFRKTFFLLPVAYFLTYMAISVNNFNLGIFSIVSIALICFSYYFRPENEYFVWNFNRSSRQFLLKKIRIGLTYFSLLVFPSILALEIFFFENSLIISSFFLLACAYMIAIVLAKYAAYPAEISLPQGLFIAFSLLFPPILIGVIPFFYQQSLKNLTSILHD